MSTTSIPRRQKKNVLREMGKTVVIIAAFGLLLLVIGFTMSQMRSLSTQLQSAASLYLDTETNQLVESLAPAPIVMLERTAPLITYVTWAILAVGIVWLLFFSPERVKRGLTESGKPLDVLGGIIAGAFLGGLTGLLWAVFNPVLILPPFIHLRIFSPLVSVWGVLNGRATGFLTGYFGSVVWAFLTPGALVFSHTFVIDGIFVGLFTGWFLSVTCRRGMEREELLQHITNHRWRYYLSCAAWGLIGCVIMSFFVAASLKATVGLSWWASFWAIGILSDTLPILIWFGPLSEAALRLTRKITWLPNF